MDKAITGIHHITAITSDAQANVDFYTGALGLRLVKLTVNFDDPGSYHFYYGDEAGHPGTALTFFAWPGAYRGRIGTGQVVATAFSTAVGSLTYWKSRLEARNVSIATEGMRFEQAYLAFDDPDGMRLEIIEADDARSGWQGGPIPAAHALRGFHSATISEEGYERTAKLMTDTMHWKPVTEIDNRFRYGTSGDVPGAIVDVVCQPDAKRGSMGAGVVHHIAFRVPDDAQQAAWLDELVEHRFNVSPVMERQYFRSIYFREPGGVLFEFATDGPGFTADEALETLGTHLKLPPWLEPQRAQIETMVPPLRLPTYRDS